MLDENTNTRHGERYTVKSVVNFQKANDNPKQVHSGLTLDLNLRGACLFSSTILKEGDALHLTLVDGQSTERTTIEGRVVWVSVDDLYGDSTYWLKAGVAFNEVNDEQSRALQKMLPAQATQTRQNKNRKHLLAVLP